jgi:DNA repair protein RecN (Recombination protein N)
MLLALSIRDFVIVDHLELEFSDGFTVLTGETGAGKSILIDALQFALGERAAADTVREGSARAEVGAEFAGNAAAGAWLAQAGFEEPDDGAAGAPGAEAPTLLLRRTLDSAGRSRSFINGSPATLGQLRELGALLLDVHGQHEHQSLLRASAQGELLDRNGGLTEMAAAVALAHGAWRRAAQASAQAQAAREQAAAESDQLQQTVEELGRLAPEAGEWERIEAEQKRLAHGSALLEGARLAVDAITDCEDAVQARLAKITARLQGLSGYDPRLSPIVSALAGADIQLEEAARELHQYVDHCETDEGRCAQVEERIAALHAAGRKWRCPPAQLHEMLEATRARLGLLAESGDLETLRAAETQAQARYQVQARGLSQARQAAAARMGREVTQAMQELAMTGGRFEVRLLPTEAGAGGLERIEFLVSAHEAGSARALAKVASGGELSRIGLAIAVVAASANLVPTLIFDEVDAGVGGQVASTVGRLLRQLGQSRQVFCVTHLPQVASCGDHHLAVRKQALADGRPVSRTEALSGTARVGEIARMLGGAQVTTLTQKHAREMLASR